MSGGGDYDWWHGNPEYKSLEDDIKCNDCGTVITAGDGVQVFDCWETDEDEMDVPLSDWVHCERCSNTYQSLIELGFYVSLDKNRQEQNLEDYHDISK